ncbi:nuclear autoantigen Sp-100 isoform X3 [Tenrec ecaudatus]|uniref:nuclear autoantigen Sp-100 isoform X3 n=1 Tax=Tenrec ecaudatus TaxID=94439 RepID=UPI003F59D6CD
MCPSQGSLLSHFVVAQSHTGVGAGRADLCSQSLIGVNTFTFLFPIRLDPADFLLRPDSPTENGPGGELLPDPAGPEPRMASASSQLSTRMSIQDQNLNDRGVYEAIFNHYRMHKVEISHAIDRTFPFLETLRDRGLISNKLFTDCQESCRNLVPVKSVVYKVLEKLEKTFDLPLLEALFSEVNLMEYPGLKNVCEDFRNVVRGFFNCQESEESGSQPRLEQGNGENVHESLPWLYADSAPDVAEQINEERRDPTSGVNDATGSQQDNSACTEESDPVGADLSTHGSQIQPCSVCLVDIKKEKPYAPRAQARTNCHQESDVIVIDSEDNDEEEPPEASTWAMQSWPRNKDPTDLGKSPLLRKSTAKRVARHRNASGSSEEDQHPGTSHAALGRLPAKEGSVHIRNAPPAGKRLRIKGLINEDWTELSDREESPEASGSVPRNGSATVESRASSIMGSHTKKRTQKRNHLEGELRLHKGRKRLWPRKLYAQRNKGLKRGRSKVNGVNAGPLRKRRKRGPRIPKDNTMDFQSPQLPVKCGELRGILYKEMLAQGTSEKCIQTEGQRWLSPREFEIEGGREKSKNWRTSLRCGGYTLNDLIEYECIPKPPRSRKGRILECSDKNFTSFYRENSNECEVCQKGRKLIYCDTCPKSFHKTCHIHPVETERKPWSCIFCEIKAIQEHCQESQPCHQESEILSKWMQPEEQLKCEFLLLKVFCSSKSQFFANKPHYVTRSSSCVPKKPMWLNKIKMKLMKKRYRQVGEFVQDMRLIFQNHDTYYKDRKFAMLGHQQEAKFEMDFKDQFGIQETIVECITPSGPIILL